MPATRLVDVYNCKISTTQVVGASEFTARYGKRVLKASNDGSPGVAAADKTVFYGDATLRCQELDNFAAIIALFESGGAATQDIEAVGRVAGALFNANGVKTTFKRGKLVSANLSYRNGDYLSADFNFANSAASASNSSDDEVVVAAPTTIAVTASSAKRATRCTGASFDPNGAPGAIAPLSVLGFDLRVQGQVDRTYGDADFGETCEVTGYDVTGSVLFQDKTLATGLSPAQQLIDAAYGALTMSFNSAITGTKSLVLNNLIFSDEDFRLNARRFHQNAVPFHCFTNVGSTVFEVATGSNKIITIS